VAVGSAEHAWQRRNPLRDGAVGLLLTEQRLLLHDGRRSSEQRAAGGSFKGSYDMQITPQPHPRSSPFPSSSSSSSSSSSHATIMSTTLARADGKLKPHPPYYPDMFYVFVQKSLRSFGK
jgi:hypothetical protein